MKMKEKWFQLPLSGYVQRVGFYAFLIHSSTLSEVVYHLSISFPLYQSVTMNQQAVLDDDQTVLRLFDKYCEL